MPRRVVMLLAAAAAALVVAGCASVDRDDLRSDVQQVHSAAAEGALLAQQARLRRVPVSFVWLHAQELRHHVEQIAERLGGQIVKSDIRDQTDQAKLLIDEVAGALHLLHRLPGSADAAYAAEQKLLHTAQETDSLDERLA